MRQERSLVPERKAVVQSTLEDRTARWAAVRASEVELCVDLGEKLNVWSRREVEAALSDLQHKLPTHKAG
jgi:hypothetical protein